MAGESRSSRRSMKKRAARSGGRRVSGRMRSTTPSSPHGTTDTTSPRMERASDGGAGMGARG
jgi:hypothetical protein